MRKSLLRIAGLILTLAALASSAPRVQAQEPICPFCIIGYKCCIQGSHASCIPESRPCN
jgi:hypothetical protein